MGVILSRLSRKKTFREELEEIEDTVKLIETYNYNVEQRYQTVGRVILYLGAIVFFLSCLVLYYRLAQSVREYVIVASVILMTSLITIFLRKIMSWYYSRKLKSNKWKLSEMKQKKKKIIDNLMEKETYNTAKEILAQYAPETALTSFPKVPIKIPTSSGENLQLTRRHIPYVPSTNTALVPLRAGGELSSRKSSITASGAGAVVPAHHFSTRSFFDRIVELLIGDGPTNRYALICSQCHTHNGMALQEEFPYISFRCCNCFKLNPARRERPTPPVLPEVSHVEEEEESPISSDEIVENIKPNASSTLVDSEIKADLVEPVESTE